MVRRCQIILYGDVWNLIKLVDKHERCYNDVSRV